MICKAVIALILREEIQGFQYALILFPDKLFREPETFEARHAF